MNSSSSPRPPQVYLPLSAEGTVHFVDEAGEQGNIRETLRGGRSADNRPR